MMLWLIWAVPLAAFALVFLIVLVRTTKFKPQTHETIKTQPVDFDRQKAVDGLQAMIRCKTVSHPDPSLDDNTAFQQFSDLLADLFPSVHRICSRTAIGPHGILFCWPGRQSGQPAILMAHYDVVEVNEDQWAKPPFAGIIENGELWGRGTLDTKITANGILQAAETLILQGFVPEKDVWFALGGNEEVAGQDAPLMVDYFREKGIRPRLVLDEGGAVVDRIFPGVSRACAVVGTAEKGMMQFKITAQSGGGHASAPPPRSSLGRLAAACLKVESKPFPRQLTVPAAGLFDTLGRYSTLPYRMIFANLWLFAGLLDLICKKRGGELNALLRTTVAWTQASGSAQTNVMPPLASMAANIRLIGSDTGDSAVRHLEKIIGDPDLRIETLLFSNPSKVSGTGDCEAWHMLGQTIRETWPEVIVSPYLMVACSDSRHYCQVSDHVYRFSPMPLPGELRKTIHGNNERIPLDSIGQTVEFYMRLMRKL
jgi:carboxypeptidase PM20D1